MWLPCRDDTIKIKVQVEGRSLPVYQVKYFSDAEPLRSEGWICSEEGKTYKVVADTSGYTPHQRNRHKHLRAKLKVDGITTQTYGLMNHTRDTHFKGPSRDAQSYQEYKFAKPQLLAEDAEEDEGSGGGVLSAACGSIEVTFMRIQYKETKRHSAYQPQAVQMTGAVSEKSKKGAMSLVTQLGEIKQRETSLFNLTNLSIQDQDSNPYCKLILRYGSKSLLMAMDIVPRDADARERSDSQTSDPDESELNSELNSDLDSLSEDDDDESRKPRIPSPDPERIAAEERLRRAREEVEATERAEERLRRAREEMEAAVQAEERLQRARRELEEAEQLASSLQQPTATASTSKLTTKRRRGGEDEDDKATVKRKLQSEMTESLKRYHGTTIDLTSDDETPVMIVKGETLDLTGA